VNLSTDGQRPGERMMLILGLRFLGRTRPGEHPKGRVFRSTWVENKKNASRMPPDQRSDMRTTLSTTRKSRERSGDVQPLGYGLRPGAKASHEIFELEPGPPPSLWKCGNRAFWVLARFPSAGGSVEKSRFASAPALAVGWTFPRFPRRVISTASTPGWRSCGGFWLALTAVEKSCSSCSGEVS